MKMFAMNFFMANVREMVNKHLPVALKLINSAALVAILFQPSALLALCVRCLAGLLLQRLSLKPTEIDEMQRYAVLLPHRSLLDQIWSNSLRNQHSTG